jgi:hypothetical protein
MACARIFISDEGGSTNDFWDDLIELSGDNCREESYHTETTENDESEAAPGGDGDDEASLESDGSVPDEIGEADGVEHHNNNEAAFLEPSDPLACLLRTHGVPAGEEAGFLQVVYEFHAHELFVCLSVCLFVF